MPQPESVPVLKRHKKSWSSSVVDKKYIYIYIYVYLNSYLFLFGFLFFGSEENSLVHWSTAQKTGWASGMQRCHEIFGALCSQLGLHGAGYYGRFLKGFGVWSKVVWRPGESPKKLFQNGQDTTRLKMIKENALCVDKYKNRSKEKRSMITETRHYEQIGKLWQADHSSWWLKPSFSYIFRCVPGPDWNQRRVWPNGRWASDLHKSDQTFHRTRDPSVWLALVG